MTDRALKEKNAWYVRMPELNLTLCRLQSRLQHICHGQSYARVDLNPMPESTLSPSQGLRIWPRGTGYSRQLLISRE